MTVTRTIPRMALVKTAFMSAILNCARNDETFSTIRWIFMFIPPDNSVFRLTREFRGHLGLPGTRSRQNLSGHYCKRGRVVATVFFTRGFSRKNADQSAFLGKWMVKVVPFPSSEETVTSPRWRSARCFTIANPRPVPPISLDRARSAR